MNRLSTWNYTALALALTLGCFDTAMGQSFALQTPSGTAVPQISLTVPSGGLLGQVPYKAVSATATNYTVSLSLALNTVVPYFALTQTGGSTPLSFDLYQQFGAPDGPYTGNLIISSTAAGTTPVSVPINITIGGTTGSGGALTSNPPNVTFTAQTGTSAPGQFLTVTAPNNAVTTFNVVATTLSGNWLAVFPTTAVPTGPTHTSQVAVTVSLAGLVIGTYNGTITLSPAGGGTPTMVPVTLNVTGLPSVSFSPSTLNFAYQTGTSTAGLAQTVTFYTDSVNPLFYTLSAQYLTGTPGWLIVSPLGGTVSKTVPVTNSVTILPNNLATGTYTAEILVNAVGASNPNQTIQVSLLVSNSPLLQIGTPPQPFNYQIGQAGPAPQTISLASSSTPFPYTAAVAYDTASGSTQWLALSPASGNTPATLTLTTNPANLATGRFTASVTVSAPGAGNTPQQFPVVLNVSKTTLLTTQASSLTFNYEAGKLPPAAQQIQVGSTGTPLTYTAVATNTSCGGGWLSVQPTTGLTPATLTVSASPGGIAPVVTCPGSITLSVPGASDTLIVPVNFNVSNLPLLDVAQNSLTFSVNYQSGVSAPQFINLTSTDPLTQVTYTATGFTGPGAGNWLFVGNVAGTTPANVPVTVVPSSLSPGQYSGTVTITSPNLPTSENLTVTMNVLSNVSAVASPSVVNLVQVLGSSAAVTQTVQITTPASAASLAFSAFASTATGGNWLSVAPAAGVSPGSIVISGNSNGQLSKGNYTGTVTIQIPGAANSPVSIPVTLTVGTVGTLIPTPSSLSFYGSVGGLNPPAQTVQITSSDVANLTIAISNTTCGGNWFSVAPLTGSTPATITVTPNVAGLGIETCSGTISVTAPGFVSQTLNVSLTMSTAPSIGKVQNSASFAFGAISPGEILYLEGSNLGPDGLTQLTLDPTTHRVTTDLAGTQVLFDGQPAPLVYVSPTKVSAIVPYEIAGRPQTNIQIRRNGFLSSVVVQAVGSTAPGIFTANASGLGQAAALNQIGSYNGPAAPAPIGSVVSIYGTGEGLVSPLPITGSVTPGTPPFPQIVAPVTVKLGGVPLDPTDITYAGPAPTLVAGAIQINFRVPSWALSGPTSVQIIIGNNASNSATVVVGPAQ